MIPRDVVKLAFQFTEHPEVPYTFAVTKEQEAGLTAHYGGDGWKETIRPYFSWLTGVDNFLSAAGFEELPDGYKKDICGCVWNMGSTHHLVRGPLREPAVNGYRLPDIHEYHRKYVEPAWARELESGHDAFRGVCHSYGLFERAWSLRGFQEFCVDLCDCPAFCQELLEQIAQWFLDSLEHLLKAPVDAIMVTDDYADQRGMIFGLDRWREFFKPHYRRLFQRIRKAGVYSVMHVCGNAAPAVPDLIDCGLDCLESLQPEAMDVYKLKREYGRDLRFWGGLGAQHILPYGTPREVRTEVRRLKREMARGGGYVLAGARGIGAEVPVPNVVAYLEEAVRPRED